MEYSKDNTMTRKEYLKSKKKYKFNFRKIKYVFFAVIVVLLGIYVFNQLKVYNSVTQIANKVLEESKLTRTMTMYYVSNSYTKDGDSKVVLYKSLDESRTNIVGTENMKNISVKNNKLYGIIADKLYSIDLIDYTKEVLADKKIIKYAVRESDIFIGASDGIYKYNILSKEIIKIANDVVDFIEIDETNIYAIVGEKSNKSIVKYDLNGGNRQVLVQKGDVAYMYVSKDNILFSKSKTNGIYAISKQGEKVEKITDDAVNANNFIQYNGDIYYINKSDKNTVYKINIKSQVKEQIIKKKISSMQMDDGVIYLKLSDSIAIDKYIIETSKLLNVTSVRASEYICIN